METPAHKKKCKQQVMKAFEKHMLEKNKYKRSNIYQESNECVEDKAL